jgi:hypothetical protein
VAAFDEAGNRAVIAYDDSLNQGKAHRKAALALCSKMGWSMDIIGGGIRDGYAFVFRDSDV